MNRQVLRVSITHPGAYRTVSQALAAAEEGALISIAPGTYQEALTLNRAVTLSADGDPGSVRLESPVGSTVVVDAEAVQLSGLTLAGSDANAAVVDVRRGQAALDGCTVMGNAWAAVIAWQDGQLAMRDCRASNPGGAGIVVTAPTANTMERTTLTDLGSSAVVVAENGRLTVRGCVLERVGGNGICVNGQGVVTVESTTVTKSEKPAVVVEQQAKAELMRVTVTGSTSLDAYLTSTGLTTFTECSLSGSGGQSVHISGGAAPVLRDCTLDSATTSGLQVTGGSQPRLENCAITGTPLAVLLEDGSQAAFVRLRVRGAARGTAQLSGGATAVFQELSAQDGSAGLRVSGSARLELRDGDLDFHQGTGVELNEGSTARLDGVRLRAAGDWGIAVSGGARAEVESSTVADAGVLVGTDGEVVLRNSELLGSSVDGARVLGGAPSPRPAAGCTTRRGTASTSRRRAGRTSATARSSTTWATVSAATRTNWSASSAARSPTTAARESTGSEGARTMRSRRPTRRPPPAAARGRTRQHRAASGAPAPSAPDRSPNSRHWSGWKASSARSTA